MVWRYLSTRGNDRGLVKGKYTKMKQDIYENFGKITTDKYDGVVFSNGKRINANISLSEINGDIYIKYGYDGDMFIGEFTKEERIELADYMINLWKKFKKK